MIRSLSAARSLAALSIAISAAAPHPASGQHCLRYQDYTHWVSSVATSGTALDVVVRGDYAYVVSYWGAYKLSIIDVSDPAAPSTTAELFLWRPHGLDLAGDLACVANGDRGFAVVDVSDPAAPALLGSVETPGEAFGVRVRGSLAYVADGLAGIHVIDVSVPAAPTILGSADTAGEALRLALDGDYCYVADRFGGLRVFDVSNPASPALVASLALPGEARDVVVEGARAFVASGPAGLQIVDIANPRAPTVIGAAPGHPAQGIYIEGSTAYLVSPGSGLYVYDVADPASPLLLGHPSQPTDTNDLVVWGGLAFMVTEGLYIVDVSNPAAAPGLGHVDTPGRATDVVSLGTTAYVADGAGDIRLVDFSDPASPTIVGNLDTPGQVTGIERAGDHLCAIAGMSGLHVIDVSSPSGPTVVGSVSWPNTVFESMVVEGHHAFVGGYIAPNGSEFLVIDLSNPAAPAVVHEEGWGNSGFSPAAARDGYLYGYRTGEMYCKLAILDIHDPASPTWAGELDLCGGDIWIDGKYAFIAGTSWGLLVMDLTDPLAPTPVTSIPLPTSGDVAGSGGYLYLGSPGSPWFWSGVQVVDISRPWSPAYVGESFAGGSIAVAGDLLLVAAWDSGLYILPAQCPATVSVAGTGSGSRASRLLSLVASPNPAAGPSLLRFGLSRAGEVSLAVHDVAGRLVRALVAGPLAAGSHEIAWDGCDHSGREVASGIYFARLVVDGEAAEARIVRAR